MPMRLIRAKCGGGEKILYHSLHSLRDIPFTLSGHRHSLRGCFLSPLSTRQAVSTLANSFLQDWGFATKWGRGSEAGNIHPFSRESVAEFGGGTLPFQSNFSVSPHVSPSSMSRRGHPEREGQAITQPSSFYRMPIKPELNWNISSSRRHRSWLKGMNISGPNMPGTCKAAGTDDWPDWCHLPGGIVQVSSTEAVKLLPWCISAAVHFYYISRPVTIAAQQDEGIPTVSEPCLTAHEPELCGSPVPGPSGGLTLPPGTPPLPVSPLPDIPLAGTPMLGNPFSDFLPSPYRKGETNLPAICLIIITPRGPMFAPQKLRQGLNPALLRVTKTHLNWFQRLDPDPVLNKKSRNLPVPSVPQGHH